MAYYQGHSLRVLLTLCIASLYCRDVSSLWNPSSWVLNKWNVEDWKTKAATATGQYVDATVSSAGEFCTIASKWSLNKIHNFKEFAFGGQCPYVENPVESLSYILDKKIVAQPLALRLITAAFDTWDLNRKAGISEPMVLAFTGPTGVGKTETANIIGEAIFELHTRVSQKNTRTVPRGLLILRGENFSDPSVNVSIYHNRIKSELASHLDNCSGNALVVFDEVQKVVPGTLDILVSAMDQVRPEISYRREGSNTAYRVSCENVGFILISDIGVSGMKKLLLEYPRGETPEYKIQATVKKALDDQFVNSIIPFLPLTPKDIRKVTTMKLQELGVQLEGKYWSSLSFDSEVAMYLSLQQFIQYEILSEKNPNPNNRKGYKNKENISDKDTLPAKRIYAKYGARNVVVGGPMNKIKALLAKELAKNKVSATSMIKIQWTGGLSPGEYVRLSKQSDQNAVVEMNSALSLKVCKGLTYRKNKDKDINGDEFCRIVWKGHLH